MAPTPLTREELEALAGEPLPDRVAMSLIDAGVVLIGPPGPDLPTDMPTASEADEHVPQYRTQ